MERDGWKLVEMCGICRMEKDDVMGEEGKDVFCV